MKIHLIRSRELDHELFTQVLDILRGVPGPLSFLCEKSDVIDFNKDETSSEWIPSREHFEKKSESKLQVHADYSARSFPMERPVTHWDTLFEKCAKYRAKKKLPDNELVVLLTDIANRQNWFAAFDEHMTSNAFVHTADWDHYIECNPAFPIAYEVLALILQKHMFRSIQGLRRIVHNIPLGCVNDMCIQKREIILKLRTADVCSDCMKILKDNMPLPLINHAISIMESLRVKMLFSQNLRQSVPLSKLVVTKQKKIFLPDFGNIEIKLRPLEKAVYLLFLHYPEGIFLSSLSDHRDELFDIYSRVSNSDDLEQMHSRINDLTNALSNSASEKISRIKRCFEEAIGLDLAQHYYIQGGNGEVKKIQDLANLVVDLS